ncbi:hypothetical protein C2G38_964091 [Gigaspora rosea]|uniref:Uncharacterized protein n=1 Tax=Gigaspora rosea TaxID=44941 RepID=A0A397VLD7_9GLOM|nr:hypothetical protein C2G38_964091 [Gigaspora rosea]
MMPKRRPCHLCSKNFAMKLFNFSYKLIAQCLFLIFLCAFIKSTKSEITFFNYTEKNINNTPIVLDLHTYDDGTTLALIARMDPTLNENCKKNLELQVQQGHLVYGLEQILRIRVIQLNGTVIEINLNNLDLKLDPLNYCGAGAQNLIRIYALQKPFILVIYVDTTNSSDPTNYEEWGIVIDWDSGILSKIYFGPTYVNSYDWTLASTFHLNINKKLGFLRVNIVKFNDSMLYKWQQYSINDSGNVSMLQTDSIVFNQYHEYTSFQVTPMSTVDGGYALIYANTSHSFDGDDSKSLSIRGTVRANFISYNKTVQDRTVLLYEISHNITFVEIYCDIASIGVGQVCTISVKLSTANNSSLEYMRVYFSTSGSVSKLDASNFPNVTNITSVWEVRSMAFGGYILYDVDQITGTHYIYAYDEYNIQTPLFSTISQKQPNATNNFPVKYNFGAKAIMNNNNTFLLPTFDIKNSITSWSLLAIPLPKVLEYHDHGYGNLQIDQINPRINGTVDSSTETLNITFFEPVYLSAGPTSGNITIYKTSDNSIRQIISPTKDFCKISSDGKTININIIGSTFNQYKENYYVQMDNNFVKSSSYNEPLKGIADGVWSLTSKNMNLISMSNSSGGAVVGLVGITKYAMESFLHSSRSDYFTELLNEIAIKVPVRRTRLSTNEKFQYINYGKPDEQIIFSINVNLPDLYENNVDSVVSDIDTMIKYKRITTFFTNRTNDLDENYGFKIKNDSWVDNSTVIIAWIVILVIFTILYILSSDIFKPYFDHKF